MLYQQLGAWKMPTAHILARWSTYLCPMPRDIERFGKDHPRR